MNIFNNVRSIYFCSIAMSVENIPWNDQTVSTFRVKAYCMAYYKLGMFVLIWMHFPMVIPNSIDRKFNNFNIFEKFVNCWTYRLLVYFTLGDDEGAVDFDGLLPLRVVSKPSRFSLFLSKPLPSVSCLHSRASFDWGSVFNVPCL